MSSSSAKQKDSFDILSLDEKIKQAFQNDYQNLEKYKKNIKQLETKLKKSSSYKEQLELRKEKEKLEKRVESIESGSDLTEYLHLSQKIVNNYLEILKVPVKIDFFTKKKISSASRKKKNLFTQFLDIAKHYITVGHFSSNTQKTSEQCTRCGKSNFRLVDNYATVCDECGVQSHITMMKESFKDIERINSNTIYKYTRITHFKDTVNQFQGKQNKYIPPKVYKDLEFEFKRHNLLNDNPETSFPEVSQVNVLSTNEKSIFYKRHSRIKKEHIRLFLQETSHSKYYEDINLIHYYFTGIPPPDISHLETVLYDDFKKFEIVYADYATGRINFLNNNYILFQLLTRRKYKCNVEDFQLLKTIDRIIEYEELTEKIFNDPRLEWTFTRL
jgi:ribosomal protein L37E